MKRVLQLKQHVLKFFVIGTALVLTGCGATGPAYVAEPEMNVGSDKALVYIYRPSAFAGSAVTYDVHVGPVEDDKAIVELKNGGYFPYYTTPGEIDFWAKTESTSSVTLDLKAGDVKYIKGVVNMGFVVGRPELVEVSAEQGQADLAETKRLEPAK